MEVWKQRRILNKDGKCFCFNCLTSEYNVNCQYCHKRINSGDELAYWGGGVVGINGVYNTDADDCLFTCLGCDEKIREKVKNGVKPSWHSGWGPILFPEHNIRKCRIAGCSQKPYYECMDLCLPHSKPCKGGKIKSNGRRCSATMGTDEGDICEFCQNQKSNKSNCNCQSALDKLQDWEVNAKAKLLANCQNDKHVGYYEDKEDREGTYLNILTKKCVCGSVLFGNKYGDEMVECSKCRKSGNNSQKQATDTNNHKRKGEELDSECEPKKLHYDSDKSPVSKIGFVNNEKSDSENNPIKPNNKTLIINLKTIKKITLTSDGNLVIEFNINDKSETQIITNKQITNSQELQKAKNYLQKANKSSISQQEFNSLINTNSAKTPASTEKPKDNHALLIGGGIAVLVVGVVIGLLVSKKSKKTK